MSFDRLADDGSDLVSIGQHVVGVFVLEHLGCGEVDAVNHGDEDNLVAVNRLDEFCVHAL